jgi:CheY-like chemotaxis protein
MHPAVGAAAEVRGFPQYPEQRGGGTIRHVPQTVLIVDDHACFRGFARRLLKAGGVDGASALAAVEELRPELLRLDVTLPDTDGSAVARRLVGDGSRPVVVLSSSREASEFGQRLQRTRARGFIHKDELSAPTLGRLAAETQ